jgi:hypothetical protein
MHLEQVVRPVAHMTLATAREPGAKKGHQMSGATVNQGSMQALDPGACLGAVYAAAVMGASRGRSFPYRRPGATDLKERL